MAATHESHTLFLQGPAGRLEAILWKPLSRATSAVAALVCHPHPLYGGTLHNKVVYQVAKSLEALGVPVLRFNFRGAGRSEGTHDKGRGEAGDVQAALDFLAAEFPGVSLLVAGFSFGAWVGLRVGCADQRVSELIGLGTPVNNSDLSYLQTCAKPKLFVQGSKDEHGDIRKLRTLVAQLPGETRLVTVDGAEHFFAGKLQEVDRAITAWLTERRPALR
jgi:uncharacterized protein